MPDLRGDPVIALLVSDIHLSHRPPIARSVEKSWYEVMKCYLEQLYDLSVPDKTSLVQLPIICAGDVFHKWNECPELVNFALEYLPTMYAIPGQHDLPHHRYDNIKKSVFWTMVKARRIILLDHNEYAFFPGFNIHGFPFGSEFTVCSNEGSEDLQLAVVHSYIWMNDHCYQDASPKQHLKKYLEVAKTYDACLFGDNHKGFLYKGEPNILNPGSFMRRRIDEIDLRPCVGKLHKSGKITRHFLDTSEDQFLKVSEEVSNMAEILHLEKFVEELEELGDKTIDFVEVLKQFLDKNNIQGPVRNFVVRALGEKHGS